jgi:hypothetical protein
MARVPLQIAAGKARIPRKAKFTVHDVPGRVHNPGEQGYHGPSTSHPNTWESGARMRNLKEKWAHEDAQTARRQGAVLLGLGGGFGALGVGGGVAVHRVGRKNAAAARRRAGISKAKWQDAWHTADPFIRHARVRRGVHDITSLEKKPGRFERAAGWANKHPQATVYGGYGLGLTATGAGLASASHQTKTAQRDVRRHKAAQRRAAVGKALYAREERVSPVRAVEMAGGLALGAWGAGRSKMVGAALARGVKMANTRGADRALYALKTAQVAQGSLKRGTAPGERALRQIQAVDRAVRAVPRPLRGDVATAAGLLLAGNATPVRRQSYTPVSHPIPSRPVGW